MNSAVFAAVYGLCGLLLMVFCDWVHWRFSAGNQRMSWPVLAVIGTVWPVVGIWIARIVFRELLREPEERTLGQPDDASGDTQSEYIIGAVPNEITFNIPNSDKAMVDLTFVGADHETRDAATGVKPGTRPGLVADAAFNTSSDVSRLKFAATSSTDSNPTPLFTFVSELKVMIANNITLNKAVSVLGGFEATAGTIDVSAEVTAYFATVAALDAKRNNTNTTIDAHLVRDNAGISIDIPLVSLTEGIPDVQVDEPITLPLKTDAASAIEVDSNLNHTILLVFFDYLPSAADV